MTLPAIFTNTDAPDATYLKFKEGCWSVKDGTPMPAGPLLAGPPRSSIKRWESQRPVEIIEEAADGSLPDVEELNKSIPRAEWESDLEGKPRPPYQLEHSVSLIDVATGKRFVHASATIGAKITILALRESINWVSAIRGPVLAVVELSSAEMKTKFGTRRRPDVRVMGWQGFAGEDAPAVPRLMAVKPPSISEDMDDDFGDAA